MAKEMCDYLSCVSGWVLVGSRSMTFCWQGRRKTCVVSSCYTTAMSKGLCEGYSACGRQQGAERERLQMCEHPKAMRQPWAPMTWPSRGAGLWFGTARWCPWSAALGLCACASEQSCMKSHKWFFSPCAVPAWLTLTLVSVVRGHTHISKNKPTAGANSLCGRSKWETVGTSPFWISAFEVERTKWKVRNWIWRGDSLVPSSPQHIDVMLQPYVSLMRSA